MNATSAALPVPFASTPSLRSSPLPSATSLTREQSDFSRILSMSGVGAGVGVGSGSGESPGSAAAADRKARDTAERLVAVVLVQPILKQVRESNQAAPPFQPTRGEQQFQSMLDAKLAQEIAQSARFPLVDRLARDMRQ